MQLQKVYIRFRFAVQAWSKLDFSSSSALKIHFFSFFQANITVVENWIPNEISSTAMRLYLRRGLSVKYLLTDEVIDYISKYKLYGSDV